MGTVVRLDANPSVMKQTLNFFTNKLIYLGIARYVLGLTMLPYAVTKILKTQFVLTGFTWTQSQSLETIPGTTIAWAFLGHTGWFQVLLGFLELVPALFLLFRRTTLLGAMLMLPVSLNIFFINFALDLWSGTKIISSSLLTLNVLILALESTKINSLFKQIIDWGSQFKFSKIELAINGIVIVIVLYLASKPLLEYRNQQNELTGDWLNQQPLEWLLESEQVGDSTLARRDLSIYFGPYGIYNAAGESDYQSASYTVDKRNQTFTLKGSDGKTINCKYKLLSADYLKIVRPPDSTRNLSVTQFYRKRIINNN